ncbi:MAG: VCBS repeat-containing protein [Chryseolinea sp.]
MLELLSKERTGINFINQLDENENLNIITFEYFYNGAGVGVGDINNDNLSDIFFAGNMVSNRLYLNKGDLQFEDITQQASVASRNKWATGISMVDINQDGWLDIYVCYAGPYVDSSKRANELYINNGNSTFTEKAHEYGIADVGHSVQAAFFDYDRDGDLDMYLLTNITDQTGPNVIRPKRLKGEMVNTDRLYRNNGDSTFSNISNEAGITIEGYGLGVSICDINCDDWPDIYVSNDYLSNDLLYINNGNGTFTDRAAEYFNHTSYSAMGNDVADYNNDGLLDLISVDMLPPDNKRQKLMFGATNYDRFRSEITMGYAPQYMRNILQLGRGKTWEGQLMFSEIGQLAGVSATDWSWSPLFADVDNDGWKDLLITNGYPRDITNRDFVSYKANELLRKGYHEGVENNLLTTLSTLDGAYLPNFVFQNKGDLTFQDQSPTWGFTKPSYSTGAAYADLDNDGDLDYVTNNTNEVASVFENHSNYQIQNHFLRIKLQGPLGNRDGIGAKVILTTSERTQFLEHSPYRGYQSTVEKEMHFGLGKDTIITSLRIQWPDGTNQELKDVVADRTIEIKYQGETQRPPNRKQSSSPYFSKTSDTGINFKHNETHYADFKIQPLLPHKYSQEGPGIAVGDVNGDDLNDFFISGAYNQSGQLYIQKKNGSFMPRTFSSGIKYEEDMGTLFFDADLDGDDDLYIVSGGNEFQTGSHYYQDRFYVNDGKGNFTLQAQALPTETASGSCVIASDYDNDGDLDLFVGGRLTPQKYPEPGISYILQNDGGHFLDVTDKVAPGLKNSGMITGALWTDFNNDNQIDLIVVGEWMPVSVYENKGGRFENVSATKGLQKSSGWWNSIHGADVDNDGDVDYVLGNMGLNTRYKPSPEKPVRAYVTDFNQDGSNDAVLSTFINGVSYPAHPRDDLFQRLPSFKKYYPSYKAYADETMEGFLNRAPNTKPEVLQFEIAESSVLINEGREKWKFAALPIEAQFAPMYGIVSNDYSRDGLIDIIISGNSFAPDVLTGRYDASKGLLLKGNGDGTFKSANVMEAGLMIPGDAKGLVEIFTSKNKMQLLATQNDDSLVVHEANEAMLTIGIKRTDRYADIFFRNGKRARKEFYYGNGYLSQTSRRMTIPIGAKEIVIYEVNGKSRVIPLPAK